MKKELKIKYLKCLNTGLKGGSISKGEYDKEINWIRSLEKPKLERKPFTKWLR
jgi:hypothetical protein